MPNNMHKKCTPNLYCSTTNRTQHISHTFQHQNKATALNPLTRYMPHQHSNCCFSHPIPVHSSHKIQPNKVTSIKQKHSVENLAVAREHTKFHKQEDENKIPSLSKFFLYVLYKSNTPDPKFLAQLHFIKFCVHTRFHEPRHTSHIQQNRHHALFVPSKHQTHLFTCIQISRIIITARYTFCTIFEITVHSLTRIFSAQRHTSFFIYPECPQHSKHILHPDPLHRPAASHYTRHSLFT